MSDVSKLMFSYKKTLCGMVLMKQYKYTVGAVGNWEYKWVKATEAEAQEYLMENEDDN